MMNRFGDYRVKLFFLFVVPILFFSHSGGAVQMEHVNYAGWSNSIKLTNGKIELVAVTDIGPRIIRFGFSGEQNIFKEYKEDLGKTGGDEWRLYGGHRLWHSPEGKPRTYFPDNQKVGSSWDGKTLVLRQPTETTTGIEKQMELTMDPDMNHVKVVHRLINHNLWGVELAPWALTVMAQNGKAIYPQEPFRAHTDYLLPARPLVLWHYTNMSDPRWTWGEKYIQFRQDPNRGPQKIGFMNSLGWAAYALNGDLFVKRYTPIPGATYPDGGCNTETFSNEDMLEVETLGPLTKLEPEASVEHIEHWFLFKADPGDNDTSISQVVTPLIDQTQSVLAK